MDVWLMSKWELKKRKVKDRGLYIKDDLQTMRIGLFEEKGQCLKTPRNKIKKN